MAIRGILIALIILMSALLVMVIRIMSGSAPVENNPPAEIVLEDSVLDVRTEVFEEATLERIIELAGQTAASRRETIVAQSGGTLSEIRVDKGDVVAVGDVIGLKEVLVPIVDGHPQHRPLGCSRCVGVGARHRRCRLQNGGRHGQRAAARG